MVTDSNNWTNIAIAPLERLRTEPVTADPTPIPKRVERICELRDAISITKQSHDSKERGAKLSQIIFTMINGNVLALEDHKVETSVHAILFSASSLVGAPSAQDTRVMEDAINLLNRCLTDMETEREKQRRLVTIKEQEELLDRIDAMERFLTTLVGVNSIEDPNQLRAVLRTVTIATGNDNFLGYKDSPLQECVYTCLECAVEAPDPKLKLGDAMGALSEGIDAARSHLYAGEDMA